MTDKRVNAFVLIAKKKQRDYITPEDVSDALRYGHVDCVREDLLEVIGEQVGLGVEAVDLCAYIAWRGTPTVQDEHL